MNITLNLSDSQQAGLTYATLQRNAANPLAVVMTPEQFASDLLGVQCDAFSQQKSDADLLALSSDDALMEVGLKALNASPEKKAAMIAAADAALASSPSR